MGCHDPVHVRLLESLQPLTLQGEDGVFLRAGLTDSCGGNSADGEGSEQQGPGTLHECLHVEFRTSTEIATMEGAAWSRLRRFEGHCVTPDGFSLDTCRAAFPGTRD